MAPEQVHLEATLTAKGISVMPSGSGPRSHSSRHILRPRLLRPTSSTAKNPATAEQYPEHRPDMISSSPNPARSTGGLNQTQARIHATSDHESKCANKAVQLIAGLPGVRSNPTVFRCSGTWDAKSRASRVPSLPICAMDPHRQPAIPDGRRSRKIYGSRASAS
jgi:hypothetical protein